MTRDELSNKSFGELINMFSQVEQKVNSHYQLLRYKSIEMENKLRVYNEVQDIHSNIVDKEQNIHKAIVLTKGWYNKEKQKEINNLQEKINTVLSKFFDNDYNLTLEQGVDRKNRTITLVNERNDSKKVSAMDVTLSGAEQQMAGFLIQIAAVTGNDIRIIDGVPIENSNGVIILDEAFSSFGVEEVQSIPTLLKEVNSQIILIEHKDELFEEFPIKTIRLGRDDNGSTIVEEIRDKI